MTPHLRLGFSRVLIVPECERLTPVVAKWRPVESALIAIGARECGGGGAEIVARPYCWCWCCVKP